MRYLITASLVVLVLVGLAVPGRGEMISISGRLEGDSTLTLTETPGVFVQNFTGDGDDTTFGSFTPGSTSTIDFSHPPAITISSGMLTLSFGKGGTWFGTTEGDGMASGNGTATFTIDFVITGGTGPFTGVTGEATITGMITQTGPTTESITGSYVGSVTVPEPGSLAVLAPALAVGAVVMLRGRRREAMARSSD